MRLLSVFRLLSVLVPASVVAAAAGCADYAADSEDASSVDDGGSEAAQVTDGSSHDVGATEASIEADGGGDAATHFTCPATGVILCDEFERKTLLGGGWTKEIWHDQSTDASTITDFKLEISDQPRDGKSNLRVLIANTNTLRGRGLTRSGLPVDTDVTLRASMSLRLRNVRDAPLMQLAAFHFAPTSGADEYRVLLTVDKTQFKIIEQRKGANDLVEASAFGIEFDSVDYIDGAFSVDLKARRATFTTAQLSVEHTLSDGIRNATSFDVGMLYTEAGRVFQKPVIIDFDNVVLR